MQCTGVPHLDVGHDVINQQFLEEEEVGDCVVVVRVEGECPTQASHCYFRRLWVARYQW